LAATKTKQFANMAARASAAIDLCSDDDSVDVGVGVSKGGSSSGNVGGGGSGGSGGGSRGGGGDIIVDSDDFDDYDSDADEAWRPVAGEINFFVLFFFCSL
jgi:hypothetical protein